MFNQMQQPPPMGMINGRRSPLAGMPMSTPPPMLAHRVMEGRSSPIADLMGITPPRQSGMVNHRLMEGRNSPLADMMGMTPPGHSNMSPVTSRHSPLGYYRILCCI